MTTPLTDLRLIIDDTSLLPRVVAFLRSVGSAAAIAALAQMAQASANGDWIDAEKHLRTGFIAALAASPTDKVGRDLESLIRTADQSTMMSAIHGHGGVACTHQSKRTISVPCQACEVAVSTLSMPGRGSLAVVNLALSMHHSTISTTLGIWSKDSVSFASTMLDSVENSQKLSAFDPDTTLYLMETMARINSSAVAMLHQWTTDTLDQTLSAFSNEILPFLANSSKIVFCREATCRDNPNNRVAVVTAGAIKQRAYSQVTQQLPG